MARWFCLLERYPDGETAFPILLVDLARCEGALEDATLTQFWPMVRRAASFLVRNGPVTHQDRWGEDPGFSPFTLAVEIAALLAAADLPTIIKSRTWRLIYGRQPTPGTPTSNAGPT